MEWYLKKHIVAYQIKKAVMIIQDFKLKTVVLMVNKAALPQYFRKKLKLE